MYNYSLEEQLLRGFIMMYVFFIIIMVVAAIALYVLKSAGLYKMAKNRGMENAWAAWIPYMRVYYQGELAGTIRIGQKNIKHPGIWMLVIPLVSGVVVSVIYVIAVLGAVTMGIIGNTHNSGFLFAGTFPGLLMVICLFVAVISIVLIAAAKVLRVFVNRGIYGQVTDENTALLHAVVGVLIPGYESVCIFIYRNKNAEIE